MESAAARDSNAELYISLLDTPEHIQTEVSKNKSANEASIPFLKENQKLAQPRYQGPVSCELLGDVAENSAL